MAGSIQSGAVGTTLALTHDEQWSYLNAAIECVYLCVCLFVSVCPVEKSVNTHRKLKACDSEKDLDRNSHQALSESLDLGKAHVAMFDSESWGYVLLKCHLKGKFTQI